MIGGVDHYGINITSSYKVSTYLNFTGYASLFYFD